MGGSKLFVLVAMVVAGSAVAQTGSRLPNGNHALMVNGGMETPEWTVIQGTKRQSLETASVGREVARCIAAGDRRGVAAYLAAPAPAKEPFDIAFRRCMEIAGAKHDIGDMLISMPIERLRGMLAEAMVNFAGYPALPVEAQAKRSYAASWMSPDAGQRAVEEMGVCIAETHPNEAVTLLHTPAELPQAGAATGAVASMLSSCLQKDATLHINAEALRSAVALGYYHRMIDAQTAAPQTVATVH